MITVIYKNHQHQLEFNYNKPTFPLIKIFGRLTQQFPEIKFENFHFEQYDRQTSSFKVINHAGHLIRKSSTIRVSPKALSPLKCLVEFFVGSDQMFAIEVINEDQMTGNQKLNLIVKEVRSKLATTTAGIANMPNITKLITQNLMILNKRTNQFVQMNKYMCEPVIPGECVIKIAIDKQILSSARHYSSDKRVSNNTNKQLTPLKCSVELFVGSDKKFEFKIDTKKPLSGKAKVKSIVDKCQQTMAVISFQKPKRGLREELEKGIKIYDKHSSRYLPMTFDNQTGDPIIPNFCKIRIIINSFVSTKNRIERNAKNKSLNSETNNASQTTSENLDQREDNACDRQITNVYVKRETIEKSIENKKNSSSAHSSDNWRNAIKTEHRKDVRIETIKPKLIDSSLRMNDTIASIQDSGNNLMSGETNVVRVEPIKREAVDPNDKDIKLVDHLSEQKTCSNIKTIKQEVFDISEEELEIIEERPPKKKKKRVKALDDKCCEMSDEMIDYYLVLSLKQCLASNETHVSIVDQNLWKRVDQKLKKEMRISSLDPISCEVRFQEIFAKYLKILMTTKTAFSASIAFKCFDMLNDIDFERLSEPKHRLVSQLRHKLINCYTNECNDSNESSDLMIDIKTEKEIKKEIN